MPQPPPRPPRTMPEFSVWQQQTSGLRRDKPKSLLDLLAKIDEALRAYEEAFTPMAKRNLATALLTAVRNFIRQWRTTYSLVAVPQAVQALQAAAIDAGDAPRDASKRKYHETVCIAYAVATGQFDPSVLVKRYDGKIVRNIVDYGVSVQDGAALMQQCTKMKDAIASAYNFYTRNHVVGPDDNALKIFMAPEFFFRGSSGAYDMETAAKILPNLRLETQKPKYKDWLFVLGTAIAATFIEETRCPACGASGSALRKAGPDQYICGPCGTSPVRPTRIGAMIDNVALIQKGGEADDKNACIVQKEYVSHIDFRRALPPAPPPVPPRPGHAPRKPFAFTLPDWSSNAPHARDIEIRGAKLPAFPPTGSRDKLSPGASKFQDERMGGSIFTIDGITFGLEICLDHLNNRLKGAEGVQIQLVPSAGASLKQLACIPKGLAFNVDGLSGGKCDMRVNEGTRASQPYTAYPMNGGGRIGLYQAVPIAWPD